MAEQKPTVPKIWNEPPIITALSDRPLESSKVHEDSFELTRSMGPILDILRHHNTETPLSIAVYGAWGSGKTSAMHWLEQGLEHWREKVRKTGYKKLKPAVETYSTWFYPWKYQTKEEVWRGLVVEVILACLKAEETSVDGWKSIAKDMGKFLGKGFVHVLSSIKLKAGVAEIDLGEIAKIVEDAAETVDPQNAYLNEFESTLSQWIEKVFGRKGENTINPRRLVIFIDDLDRCMPDTALQVVGSPETLSEHFKPDFCDRM